MLMEPRGLEPPSLQNMSKPMSIFLPICIHSRKLSRGMFPTSFKHLSQRSASQLYLASQIATGTHGPPLHHNMHMSSLCISTAFFLVRNRLHRMFLSIMGRPPHPLVHTMSSRLQRFAIWRRESTFLRRSSMLRGTPCSKHRAAKMHSLFRSTPFASLRTRMPRPLSARDQKQEVSSIRCCPRWQRSNPLCPIPLVLPRCRRGPFLNGRLSTPQLPLLPARKKGQESPLPRRLSK